MKEIIIEVPDRFGQKLKPEKVNSEIKGELVRCKDCKHWDKTTRKKGNDCILGPWEDAECKGFRSLDTYGELGEDFRRTNGDWYCADGERRDETT